MMRRFAIGEIRPGDIALTRWLAGIEPRIRALEGLEPVLVVLIEPAFRAHAVDHDIDEQGELVLLRGLGELAQAIGGARIGCEDGMQAMMIGDRVSMPVA